MVKKITGKTYCIEGFWQSCFEKHGKSICNTSLEGLNCSFVLSIFSFVVLLQILIYEILHFQAKQNAQKTTIEELTDVKDFKKILRTKNNVLVCYISSQKQASNIVKIFKEAAEVVKGQGTMLLVDCSG